MKIYLDNAVFSSLTLVNLVNDLLDLAKIDSATFVFNNEYVNLIEVVQEAFSVVQFSAEKRQIKLQLVIDASKPFIFKQVWCDRRRIHQILLNFISNSIKFTNTNGFIKVHLNVLQEQNCEDLKISKHTSFKRSCSEINFNN